MNLLQFFLKIMRWFLESEEFLSNSLKEFNFTDDETEAQKNHKVSWWQNKDGSPHLSSPGILPWQSESSQRVQAIYNRIKSSHVSLLPVFGQNIQEKTIGRYKPGVNYIKNRV